jgi:cellulose synthase/poly-beta-1,6-N-acetylglucosamine synthase-like glycosyltransferase
MSWSGWKPSLGANVLISSPRLEVAWGRGDKLNKQTILVTCESCDLIKSSNSRTEHEIAFMGKRRRWGETGLSAAQRSDPSFNAGPVSLLFKTDFKLLSDAMSLPAKILSCQFFYSFSRSVSSLLIFIYLSMYLFFVTSIFTQLGFSSNISFISFLCHLCGLVVRVPGYRSRGPGSVPGATRFSEK